MKTIDDSASNPKPHQTAQKVSFGESISQRAKQNETFFSSFIDLIPARVYMNPDDRHTWMEIVAKQTKKNALNPAEKLADNEDTAIVTAENEEEVGFIKPNRFDPRFFKTVSQILNDLELHNRGTKARLDLKTNLKRAKLSTAAAQPKASTAIKVLHKSQNKSPKSGAESVESAAPSPKKPVKRTSKFKEEKRAEAKRPRQRYDSQSEPQIVHIDHSEANSTENRKPVFNKSGQMVFSKFDFTADKSLSVKKAKDGHQKLTATNAKPKDYKKLLTKLQHEKEKKELLRQSEPEKVGELELKTKWKTAIDKASGVKVKDDVDLLKKSLKRIEKKKEKSRKGWEERTKAVEEHKNKLQEKRKKNMDKRKEKNKENKMKKLKKKGRIMPGF